MKLKISDLLSLEQYDKQRDNIKKEVISHKKNRTLPIGDNIVLIFEDFLTIKYQVQEMLRIEKIFSEHEIQQEIDAYNPLIPDGDNFKATMLIMFPDVEERKIMLFKLYDIENKIWIAFDDQKIFANADEDLDRSTDDKTSAVHFLRFQLTQKQVAGFLSSQDIEVGVDHPEYSKKVKLDSYARSNLIADLSSK
tara:strand:- start:341 stop:922 length:582 start_codon:yes stop_codon:yes gene_type:complete